MSDPALMHATLFVAALSRCLLRSKYFDQDIFYHRGMTIKLMSERLEDPEFRPTDASISAIACLLGFEVPPPFPAALRDFCKRRSLI